MGRDTPVYLLMWESRQHVRSALDAIVRGGIHGLFGQDACVRAAYHVCFAQLCSGPGLLYGLNSGPGPLQSLALDQ